MRRKSTRHDRSILARAAKRRRSPRRTVLWRGSFAARHPLTVETLEDRRLLSGVTLTVNTIADTHAVSPSTSDTDQYGNVSLRSAIEYLNRTHQGGDTIDLHLVAGGAGEIDLAFGQIEIAESVDIEGPGGALLAINGGFGAGPGGPTVKGNSRIFQIDAQDFLGQSIAVTMSGLTLEGGHAESATDINYLDGGAIANSARLTLDAMAFEQNDARSNGGAIYNAAGGDLTLTGSTFSGNSAPFGGGVDNEGTASIEDSTFSNNTAATGGGIDNGHGTLIVLSDTFTENNTSFPSNPSPPDGGFIIYVSGGLGYGGGIDNPGGSLTVADSTFFRNSANSGGGIAMGSDPAISTIVDCTVSGNNAMQGGGIFYGYPFSLAGEANLANSIVAGNALSSTRGKDPDVGGAPGFAYTKTDHDLIGILGDAQGFTNASGAAINGNVVGTLSSPVDPQLGPLANNGGPTETMALLPGSPARAAGDAALISPFMQLATDQRGAPRIVEGATDIGAYELDPPASAAAVGGSGQQGMVGSAFATALTVLVTDQNGNPLPGVVVTFAAPSSGAGATFAAGATVSTGADGKASETISANTVAGTYDVTASVSGISTPVLFALTNTAGPVASIVATSGEDQSTPVATPFSNPLTVLVTDRYGNLEPGVTVTFAPSDSGATALFYGAGGYVRGPATAITADNGTASKVVRATGTAGSYDVTVAVSGLSSFVSFALTNEPGPPAYLSAELGNVQSATVNTGFSNPLTVLVTDQYGNPVPGVAVAFDAPTGGASATFPAGAAAVTGDDGTASEAVSANTVAGAYNVTASVSGISTPASFALTNEAEPAAAIVAEGGDSQSATVGAAFDIPLFVLVTDQYGNPAPGATVVFAAPSEGASATFAAGTITLTGDDGTASEAVGANAIAGTYDVTASVGGVSAAVSFALTNNPIATNTIVASSLADGSIHGEAVVFMATVESITTGGAIPTGGVAFYDGASLVDTETLDSAGEASYTTAGLAAGEHSITAVYIPTGSFSASTSSTLDQQVNPFGAASQLVFTAPPVTSTAGQTIGSSTGTQVSIEDQYGNVVADDDSQVAIAVSGAPAGGGFIPGVTSAVAAVDGVATFTSLAVNLSGVYTLNASDGSLATATSPAFTVVPNIGVLLLDQSGGGALHVSGNARLTLSDYGAIVADSTSGSAVMASGNGRIAASELDLSGSPGTQAAKGAIQGVVRSGAVGTSDPLADLPVPAMPTPRFTAGRYSGSLQPGTYVGGISVSGNSSVTLAAGVYYLEGGGLSLSGNASLSGHGVLIYNAPGSDGRVGAIHIGGNASVTLTPPDSGRYQGVTLFQDRNSTTPITVGGNAALNMSGTLYAAAASLDLSGDSQLGGVVNAPGGSSLGVELIVRDLAMSGNAEGIADGAKHAAQRATDDYFTYLDRTADSDGRAFWLGKFADGETMEDVIAGITGAAKYSIHSISPTFRFTEPNDA